MKTDNHRTDLSEEGSGAACVFTEEEKNALRMLPEYMVVLRVRGSFGECLLATDLFLKSIQMDESSFVRRLRRFSRFVYEDDIELILDTIRRSVAKPEFLCDFSVRIRKDDRNAYRKYKGAIRSVRTQRHVELRRFPGEITLQPCAGLFEHGELRPFLRRKRGGKISLSLEPQAAEGLAVADEQQPPQRRGKMGGIHLHQMIKPPSQPRTCPVV